MNESTIVVEGTGNNGKDTVGNYSSRGKSRDRTIIDEKRRRRMESNRISARHSRIKKQQRLDELITQVCLLKNENEQISKRISEFTRAFTVFESRNRILQVDNDRLNARLELLNCYIQFREVAATAGGNGGSGSIPVAGGSNLGASTVNCNYNSSASTAWVAMEENNSNNRFWNAPIQS